MRRYRILTEASGSLTAGYLIRSIQEAGHECIASDIDAHCFGRALADDFVLMPRADAPDLWAVTERALLENRIDIVIPSLDETLTGWSERKQRLRDVAGVEVVLSDPHTIAVCRDKWRTYEFFRENGIPTPATSLEQEHALIKPRMGRGGSRVLVTREPVDMMGMISQERLIGVEYTIDVFCDRSSDPVYVVPRRRVEVKDGKSTRAVVEADEQIMSWTRKICAKLPFVGPINVQCFMQQDKTLRFTEINPRVAGGMALGFAATENWIPLIVSNVVQGLPITAKPVQSGLEMRRYYAEVFVPRR